MESQEVSDRDLPGVLVLDGSPIALQRHRTGKYGNYDPQASVKKNLLKSIKNRLVGDFPFYTPLSVTFEFCFKYPKQCSKKWKRDNCYRAARPDLSNLLKFYEDLLNGVVWHDDSIIVKLSAWKLYGEEERTVISWKEI